MSTECLTKIYYWRDKMEATLEHYGVIGMRWGVRKGKSTGGRTKGHKTQLSDADLQRAIRRIEMERRYEQLTAPQKSAKSQWVKKVLSDSAQQVATQYTKQYMSKQVGKMLGAGASDVIKDAAKDVGKTVPKSKPKGDGLDIPFKKKGS